MKKNIYLPTLQKTCITFLLLGVFSCSESSRQKNSVDLAAEHNEAKFYDTPKEKDSEFLVDAAEIHLSALRTGQLAQQKCHLSEVRDLGEMMQKEHEKSLRGLTALAGKKMITLPTSLSNKEENQYSRLSQKSGPDFDKEYCENMIKSHKKAIDLFEKESVEASDPDIREWAAAALPDFRSHLDHAVVCKNTCEKTK